MHTTNSVDGFLQCDRNADTNQTLPIQEKLECMRKKSATELNNITYTLRSSMYHSGPQSSKTLLPTRNYITMAVKRKVICVSFKKYVKSSFASTENCFSFIFPQSKKKKFIEEVIFCLFFSINKRVKRFIEAEILFSLFSFSKKTEKMFY
jgi:hypothetical protein